MTAEQIEMDAPRIEIAIPHIAIVTPHIEIVTPRIEIAAPHVEIAAPHVEIAAPHIEIAAPRIEIAAPRIEIAATHTEIAAPHFEMAADNFLSTADHFETTADDFQSTADHFETTADQFQSIADHIESIADHMESTADDIESIADHRESIADRIELIADHRESIADHTESIADRTESIADRTESTADHLESIAAHMESVADHIETTADRIETIADRTGATIPRSLVGEKTTRRANFAFTMDRTDPNITRRSLLKGGLVAAAGLTLPGAASIKHEDGRGPIESVMPALANYMKEAQARPLPAEAAEHTRLHVLDTLAAMVSGSSLPPGQAALRFASEFAGGGSATVVRSKALASPIDAALANAMMAHADETDDSHAPSQSHPGCSIVPAALAAAERFGTDGARFLRAVALGYDIGTRVNMALRVSNFEVGSHESSHAFAAVWGSSVAAGCAAGLSAEQLPWLLAYAADQSSGLTVWQRDTDHIQKAFAFAGLGARNGVTAALVVRSGWTGVNDVLAGPYNFFNAYAPGGADVGVLVDKLGQRYEVVRTNIKKWTVGSPIQAPLDAIESMRMDSPFTADQVQRVVVRTATSEAKLVDNRDMPDICMQHMVAVMLLDKTVSFASAHDTARMKDPAVLRQRAKVTLIQDEDLEKLLPRRVAIVDVTLTDGTRLTRRVDAVRGTAQNPMTRAEIVAKARDLMAPVLGAGPTSSLVDKVLAVDTLRDIRELRPLLQG